MPVFGKGRSKKSNAGKSLKDLHVVERRWGSCKRSYRREDKWVNVSTGLAEIEKVLDFPLGDEIKKIAASKGRAVVLDWGCGTGKAGTEIAQRFGGKVSVYGCSDVAYKEWAKNEKVKFVQATEQDSLRYFKDGSFDLIYSHFGLIHVGSGFGQYLESILPKLSVGGKLVTDIEIRDFPMFDFRKPKTVVLGGMVFEITYRLGEIGTVLAERKK
jgi:SAM-dependent methyltransferase